MENLYCSCKLTRVQAAAAGRAEAAGQTTTVNMVQKGGKTVIQTTTRDRNGRVRAPPPLPRHLSLVSLLIL